MGEYLRVGLISSALAAISPVLDQLRKDLPEAEVLHFLDEGLLVEFARAGGLSAGATDRLLAMARSAEAAGCAAILCSCSTLSPAIDRLAPCVGIPMVPVDQEMFQAACERANRIAIFATAESVLTSVLPSVRNAATSTGTQPRIQSLVVSPAPGQPRGSLTDLRAISAAAETALADADLVLLAQCSMIGCLQYLSPEVRERVFCAPEYAVRALRRALQAAGAIPGEAAPDTESQG